MGCSKIGGNIWVLEQNKKLVIVGEGTLNNFCFCGLRSGLGSRRQKFVFQPRRILLKLCMNVWVVKAFSRISKFSEFWMNLLILLTNASRTLVAQVARLQLLVKFL